jgi:hypothetical protein
MAVKRPGVNAQPLGVGGIWMVRGEINTVPDDPVR